MPPVRSLLLAPVCVWLALCAPEANAREEGREEERLTLERAVALAAERNEVALAAEARSEAAEARVARARAFFFPELTVGGTYTRRLVEVVRQVGGQEVVLQRFNGLGGTAVARLTLFDARGFPLLWAAKAERRAAELDAVEARRQVAFEAATAFLATLGAQQVEEAAERRLAYAKQAWEDARARANSGLASRNDVTRAELEVTSAEAQLAEARGQALTARLELGYLLVAPVEGALAAPETLLSEAARPVESFQPLSVGAEERRPDILSARLRVEAQQSLAREPLARLLPTLGATGQYRLTNEAGFTGRYGDGFLMVNLSWNIFDGGELYAEHRERMALVRASTLELQARTRRVDVAVERAEVALRTFQAALERSRMAVEAARQNAEETAILYRQGLSTSLAVSDALLRQFEAEVTLARAWFSLGLGLLELRAAVGLDPLGREP
jgi:outer membrane protein TolC